MTLLDIAKLNGSDEVVGLIEEVKTAIPEIAILPSRTIAGTSYKTLTRTGLPSVAFRGANEGVATSKSTYKSELIQMYLLDGQIEMDKRVADADERGPARVLGLEASGVAKAALIHVIQQMYYGVSSDSKGFPGLKAFTPFGGDYTLNAGGTTAKTASSVFGVRFGEQDVQMLWGNNTTLTLDEWRTQQLSDSDGKKYTGYVNDLGGWSGLQIGNKYAAGRICNLTADANKGLTEERLNDFMDLYPQAYKPTHLFMSQRSMTQLRKDLGSTLSLKTKSASVRTPSSMEAKAMMEDSLGVQLVISDLIVDTDAIES
jgi:hypothetical protein